VIYIPGDFPSLLLLLTGIVGIFGIGAGTLAGIIAGGLAAAGTTAYGIKTGIEGNWPWTDPEAWFTGYAKSLVSPVGEIIADAKGEPSISEQLKGVAGEIARGGGSAGELQAATGSLRNKLSTQEQMARGVTPPPDSQMPNPQPMGGRNMEGGGGASRYDAADAAEQPPSRGKVLGGAWKNIGIQAGIQAAASAIPYVGGAIGSAVSPAVSAAAPAIATSALGPTLSTVPLTATEVAKTAVQTAVPAVTKAATQAAPSFATTALNALQQVPSFLGDNATGILQTTLKQAALGAGKGALSSLGTGEDPGRGALFGAASGGAGGFAGGVAGFGAQQFAPAPVPTIQANPFPMPEIGAPDYVGGMAPGAPTLGSFAASQVPKVASAGASGLVSHLMQPSQPSQPGAPVYSSRPSYYDVYDIGGQNATYPGRRPYWG
jgi:hypothetical protein